MVSNSPLTTCHLPQNPQGASSFLLLPAELRTKILHHLLRSSEPIPTYPRRSTRDNSETNEQYNINFSSQLLRCCQQLYIEGQHILYHKNILCIDIEFTLPSTRTPDEGPLWWKPDRCFVLDLQLRLPSHAADPISLLDYIMKQEQGGASWSLCPRSCDAGDPPYTLPQIYPSLTLFRNIRLLVCDRLLIACRVMRDFLLDKHVTLGLVEAFNETDQPLEDGLYSARNISRCRILRCRSLRIERPETSIPVIEARLSELEQVVAGPTKAIDTWQQCEELDEYVHFGLPKIERSLFCWDQRVTSVMRAAREAAEQYDVVGFEEQKGQVMEMARQWMKDSEQWKATHLRNGGSDLDLETEPWLYNLFENLGYAS